MPGDAAAAGDGVTPGLPPFPPQKTKEKKNSMVPIITRVLFSIPLVVISGSLLIETYFGIPGVGRVTFDAITSGDQPVLKAVVGLTAVAFVILQLLAEFAYRALDPRLRA